MIPISRTISLVLLAMWVAMSAFPQTPAQQQAPIDESLKTSLAAYLVAHFQTPETTWSQSSRITMSSTWARVTWSSRKSNFWDD